MKKTPWFDGAVKPVHVGVYERQRRGTLAGYWKWDGNQWLWGGESAPNRSGHIKMASPQQSLPWRGLVKEST